MARKWNSGQAQAGHYLTDFITEFRLWMTRQRQAPVARRSAFAAATYFRRLEGAGFSGASTAKTGLGLTSTSADEYQFSFATMILTGNVSDT
jgi:hypothetical protein